MVVRIRASFFVCLSVCILACLSSAQTSNSKQVTALPAALQATTQPAAAPATRRDDVSETMHGVTISDPYRWLEDQNSPETRSWIQSQNTYTHRLLDAWPGRAQVEKRATELMRHGNIRAPFEAAGRLFYRKRSAEQDLFLIYMRQGVDGKEDLLIDPLPMSTDHSTNVDILDVTRDGKLLAYLVRKGGADEFEIRVFDVDARKDLADKLRAAVYFNVSWRPDRAGFYYSMMGAEGPRIHYHAMGTDAARDVDLFGNGYGKDKIIVAEAASDGKHLVITVFYGSAGKVEVWVKDLQQDRPAELITKGIDAHFNALGAGDRVILKTDWNASRGRVLVVRLDDPQQEHWKEIVPEKEATIDNVAVAGGRLVLSYVHNATAEVRVFDLDGKLEKEMEFPTLGAVSEMTGQWDAPDGFVTFSSFVVPPTIYRFDTATKKQSEWARVQVPVDPAKFDVKQVWVVSKDGTKIPMFLVYKKGLKQDDANPALLTGYGGFNVNITPEFSAETVLFAEHGGVFAQVNLRGGGEFGESWHKAGMMERKQNVFDDFIAAGEWLIANHYTRPTKLSIVGGSNGGLLVGAALTQRPELFRAVVCWHPLLDMLRYQKFMDGQFWVSEYGSAEDAEQFKYIYAYSPYQHVQKGVKYPAVLFMTGDADTRVAPLHARKMAAMLQWATGSDHPIMIRYELTAGHSEGRSVTAQISDLTDELSFLFGQLGVS
jgi:prolyl oligopeptidase